MDEKHIKVSDSEIRIQKRATKPFDNAMNYLKTIDCKNFIKK